MTDPETAAPDILMHDGPIDPPVFGMAGLRMIGLRRALDRAMQCSDEGSMSLFENRNSRPTREWDLGDEMLLMAEIDQGHRYDLSITHRDCDGSMFRLHVDDVPRQENPAAVEDALRCAVSRVDLATTMFEDPTGIRDPSLSIRVEEVAEAIAGAAWRHIDRLARTDIKEPGVVMRIRPASPWSEAGVTALDEDEDSLGFIGPMSGFLAGRRPLPRIAMLKTTRTIATLSPVTIDLRHDLLARMRAIATYDRMTGERP